MLISSSGPRRKRFGPRCTRRFRATLKCRRVEQSQEVLISTGARDDQRLQIVRSDMIATLEHHFQSETPDGKLDINTAGQAALADRFARSAARGRRCLSDDQLQALAKAITRLSGCAHSGLIRNLDELVVGARSNSADS